METMGSMRYEGPSNQKKRRKKVKFRRKGDWVGRLTRASEREKGEIEKKETRERKSAGPKGCCPWV
jgi:hypothetical protein